MPPWFASPTCGMNSATATRGLAVRTTRAVVGHGKLAIRHIAGAIVAGWFVTGWVGDLPARGNMP